MKTQHRALTPHLLALTGAISLLSTTSRATLTLTINEATADRLSFTLGGTFDADTIGGSPGYLAIKADWSTHIGTNVPWLADALGESSFGGVPGVTITDNTTIGLVPPTFKFLTATSSQGYGDAIYYYTGAVIPAGTPVSGTFTMEGTNIYDYTGLTALQLVSGYENSVPDFVRLEATAPLPEPTTALLGTLGLGLLATRRNRRSTTR